MKQLTHRIEAHRGRTFVADGVKAYVENLWDSEGCPVFADLKKDGISARAFLKLLRKLEIHDKDIRFGSFDCNGSASRAEWKEALGLRERRSFERWRVPYDERNSVRPWLGIKPTFRSEMPVLSPGLFAFRFTMVMSFIVLEAENNIQSEP